MSNTTLVRTAHQHGSTLRLERDGSNWVASDLKGNVWHNAQWGRLSDLTLALSWEGWTVNEQRVPLNTDPLGVAKYFPRPKSR